MKISIWLLSLSACASSASTNSAPAASCPPAPQAAPVTSVAPSDPAAIEAIIADIKSGWENGDPEPFKKHFLDFDGARYVESGGQNVGLKDLIEHHVVPEKDHLDSLSLDFENTVVHFEGSFAWAISEVRVQATIKGNEKKINKKGYETFLFRWVEPEWKVVHTHSSSRTVKKAKTKTP